MKNPIGWNRIYRVVRRIPRGRISTYGAIAEFSNWPRAARHVGYALAALGGSAHDIPWHRVLGKRSRDRACVSIKDPIGGTLQRQLLEAEGVEFDKHGGLSLSQYGWSGPRKRTAKKPEKTKRKPARKTR